MDDVLEALRVWVETVTGLTTILERQVSADAPRPIPPYCAILVTQTEPASQTPYEETTDILVPEPGPPAVIKTTKKRSWVQNGILRVDVFGRGSIRSSDLIQDLQLSPRRADIRVQFKVAGIKASWLGSFADILELRDTNFEDHGQADFRFSYVQAQDEIVPWIETVVWQPLPA